MTRQMWAAMLAKWVAPMDPERAAKALVAMLPGLSAYSDGAFTEASARYVAEAGRVMPDHTYGPMTRVPTFGELTIALGRWWTDNRPDKPLRIEGDPRYRVDIPKRREPPTDDEMGYVADIVTCFTTELAERRAGFEADNPAPSIRLRSLPLSDGQLLAVYEAMGPAGVVRAQALRRKIEAAALMKSRQEFPEPEYPLDSGSAEPDYAGEIPQ